jgi:hypothetical protein
MDQREHPLFQDHCVYKLFRIFCLLAELVPESSTDFHDCFQVKIILGAKPCLKFRLGCQHFLWLNYCYIITPVVTKMSRLVLCSMSDQVSSWRDHFSETV